MQFATRAGFGGGLVVDYPNSKKAKKFYLVLWVGGEMMVGPNGATTKQTLPEGLTHDHEEAGAGGAGVKFEKRRMDKERRQKGKKKRSGETAKEYIVRKKELNRKRGKEDVPLDSKYTGRRRKGGF